MARMSAQWLQNPQQKLWLKERSYFQTMAEGMIIYFQAMDNNSFAMDDNHINQSAPTTGILYPGQNDVKFGRGGDTNYHIGNSRFRYFVNQFKQRYQAASKEERQEVVQEIVVAWRRQDPPGRFVTRSAAGRGERAVWHDVGNEMAFKKTVKVLGEGLGAKRRKSAEGTPSQGSKRKRNASPSATPAQVGYFGMGGGTSAKEKVRTLDGIRQASEAPVSVSSSDEASVYRPPLGRAFCPLAGLVSAHQAFGVHSAASGQVAAAGHHAFGTSTNPHVQATKGRGPPEDSSVASSAPSIPSARALLGVEFPPIAASLTNVFNTSSDAEDDD